MNAAPVRVAAVQMVSGPDVPVNLASADALVAEAARRGARLVVLPENFALMAPDDEARRRHAEEEGRGPVQEAASAWARRHGIWLVAGTLPLRDGTGDGRPRAASFVYGPDGRVQGVYAKIHLFDVDLPGERHEESRGIAPGRAPLVVATGAGSLALAVCYDLRFPELFRLTAGAELVALPSAFTRPTGEAHWEVLVRARAIENQCTLIAAAQGGTHPNGRRTWGHTMVVDGWGRVLAVLPEGPGVVVADHDPGALAEIRRRLPALAHRRLRVLPPED